MPHPNNFYHIYNHAIGNENLFRNPENYRFFLSKVLNHVSPVADMYSYCLLPNHFHFLMKIKEEADFLTFPKFQTLEKFSSMEEVESLQYFISKQFGNLFSSYTQSYNKVFKRRGSLFLKNFKFQQITDEAYFKNVVHYIHMNPVHHGLVKSIEDWPWSSYQSILSSKNTNIQKDCVITWFGDTRQYVEFQSNKIDLRMVPLFEL